MIGAVDLNVVLVLLGTGRLVVLFLLLLRRRSTLLVLSTLLCTILGHRLRRGLLFARWLSCIALLGIINAHVAIDGSRGGSTIRLLLGIFASAARHRSAARATVRTGSGLGFRVGFAARSGSSSASLVAIAMSSAILLILVVVRSRSSHGRIGWRWALSAAMTSRAVRSGTRARSRVRSIATARVRFHSYIARFALH